MRPSSNECMCSLFNISEKITFVWHWFGLCFLYHFAFLVCFSCQLLFFNPDYTIPFEQRIRKFYWPYWHQFWAPNEASFFFNTQLFLMASTSSVIFASKSRGWEKNAKCSTLFPSLHWKEVQSQQHWDIAKGAPSITHLGFVFRLGQAFKDEPLPRVLNSCWDYKVTSYIQLHAYAQIMSSTDRLSSLNLLPSSMVVATISTPSLKLLNPYSTLEFCEVYPRTSPKSSGEYPYKSRWFVFEVLSPPSITFVGWYFTVINKLLKALHTFLSGFWMVNLEL